VVGRAHKSGLHMCKCTCDEGCVSAGVEGGANTGIEEGEACRVRVFLLQEWIWGYPPDLCLQS